MLKGSQKFKTYLALFWKWECNKGKDPHPQDKIQHLDFTKDPRPLYYKTPPCAFFTTKTSVVRPFSVLSNDEIGPYCKTGRFLSKAEILGVGAFSPLPILKFCPCIEASLMPLRLSASAPRLSPNSHISSKSLSCTSAFCDPPPLTTSYDKKNGSLQVLLHWLWRDLVIPTCPEIPREGAFPRNCLILGF